MTTNQPNPNQTKAEIEQSVIIGFLYGIQSDMLSVDEIQHRVAGFKHTKGYSEALAAIQSIVQAAEVRADLAARIELENLQGAEVRLLYSPTIIRRLAELAKQAEVKV